MAEHDFSNGLNADARLPFGVPLRSPTRSESQFFRQNPSVSGMAAEDNSVVLSPLALPGVNKNAVALNEAARIFMRTNPRFQPSFILTEEQEEFLSKTIYANASPMTKAATIAARILSGDPSAGKPTSEQIEFVNGLHKELFRMMMSTQ